jgi:hypothetical protein
MHVLDLSKFSHEFIGARAIHRYASFRVAFDSRSSLTSVVNQLPRLIGTVLVDIRIVGSGHSLVTFMDNSAPWMV